MIQNAIALVILGTGVIAQAATSAPPQTSGWMYLLERFGLPIALLVYMIFRGEQKLGDLVKVVTDNTKAILLMKETEEFSKRADLLRLSASPHVEPWLRAEADKMVKELDDKKAHV